MKTLSTLAIVATLLLAPYHAVRAEEPAAVPARESDCNRVFKAKSDAGKTISSADIARELDLPLETVNACLLKMRQAPPPPSSGAGH